MIQTRVTVTITSNKIQAAADALNFGVTLIPSNNYQATFDAYVISNSENANNMLLVQKDDSSVVQVKESQLSNYRLIDVSGGGGGGIVGGFTKEKPNGTQDGSNVTFTTSSTPIGGSEMLYLNGFLQDSGLNNDYTIDGNTITMAVAPQSTDKLIITYYS